MKKHISFLETILTPTSNIETFLGTFIVTLPLQIDAIITITNIKYDICYVIDSSVLRQQVTFVKLM